MKNWMKVLMWLGLGGGVGFFAGYQIGAMGKRDAYENGVTAGYEEILEERQRRLEELRAAAEQAAAEYAGIAEEDGEIPPEETEPEMPEEAPEIGDEADIEAVPEVPQLHPQHMVPEGITEEEYYANPWGYDQETLAYYEEDQVLYNRDTREALKTRDEMDQVIGIGRTFEFYLKDGEALDALFVRNDTMGTLFRIDRVPASYEDEMEGGGAPEYEAEDLD